MDGKLEANAVEKTSRMMNIQQERELPANVKVLFGLVVADDGSIELEAASDDDESFAVNCGDDDDDDDVLLLDESDEDDDLLPTTTPARRKRIVPSKSAIRITPSRRNSKSIANGAGFGSTKQQPQPPIFLVHLVQYQQ